MHQGSIPSQLGMVCLIAELDCQSMTRQIKLTEFGLDSKIWRSFVNKEIRPQQFGTSNARRFESPQLTAGT